jgi:uncharacterized OB-fold protein
VRHDDDIDEGPSQDDLERFSGVTTSCPKCGTELHDDVVICWKCGHALAGEAKGPPLWTIFVAVGLLAALVLYMVM